MHIPLSCVHHMKIGCLELNVHRRDSHDSSNGDSHSIWSTHSIMHCANVHSIAFLIHPDDAILGKYFQHFMNMETEA